MSSVSAKDYHTAYQKFEAAVDSPEKTGCNKLDHSRKLQVELRQLRATYWTKPCLKNWPCVWDQDHSNIDDLQERIAAVQMSLLRQCESETVIHNVKQAAAGALEATSKAHVANVNHLVNKNNVFEPHIHMGDSIPRMSNI